MIVDIIIDGHIDLTFVHVLLHGGSGAPDAQDTFAKAQVKTINSARQLLGSKDDIWDSAAEIISYDTKLLGVVSAIVGHDADSGAAVSTQPLAGQDMAGRSLSCCFPGPKGACCHEIKSEIFLC